MEEVVRDADQLEVGAVDDLIDRWKTVLEVRPKENDPRAVPERAT
jgi:hypothetical protein